MALVLQNLTYLQEYAYSWLHSTPKKTDHPLKIGVLSTADINPAAIIHPVETHPDVVLYAVASRDAATAKSYAKKYGFQKAFGSYEELLNDAEVDFVYISLPNSLHYEWALKAVEAGKPVLVEKPFTDNHEEAVKLVKTAEKKNISLMEAFHWQFHPAAHLFREILNEEDEGGEGKGSVGKILTTEAWMTMTPWLPKKDIRWKFDLGGGSLMDETYVLSFTRFALDAGSPFRVITARARKDKDDPRVDAAMNSTLLFTTNVNAPDGEEYEVHSSIYTDFQRAWAFHLIPRVWELPSIKVETEKKIIFFYNAMMPHIYHFISVTDKQTGKTVYKKRYVGGSLWGSDYPGSTTEVKSGLGQAAESVKDTVTEKAKAAPQAAADVKGKAEGKAREAPQAAAETKGKVEEKARQAPQAAAETKGQVEETARQAPQTAAGAKGKVEETARQAPQAAAGAKGKAEEFTEKHVTGEGEKHGHRHGHRGHHGRRHHEHAEEEHHPGHGHGEAYWSTYRYQLEAFVDKLRGKEPAWWVTGQDSIDEMKAIDEVYQKSGLGLRP